MKYILTKSPIVNNLSILEDGKSINVDVTLNFNIDGGSQMPDSTVGYTVNLLLDSSSRDTMLAELNTKAQQQFDAQYNPA